MFCERYVASGLLSIEPTAASTSAICNAVLSLESIKGCICLADSNCTPRNFIADVASNSASRPMITAAA